MPNVVGHSTLKHEASKDHVEAVFQGRKITKGNLLQFIESPWRKAFSTENVRKSYAAVGVWPFDPSKIKPAAVEPSKATRVDGGFLVPVESPVKVIEAGLSEELAAMNPRRPPILTLPAVPPSPTSPTPFDASTSSSTQTGTGYRATLTMMAGSHADFIFLADPLSPSKTLHPPVIEKAPQRPNINISHPNERIKPQYRTRDALLNENQHLRKMITTANDHIGVLEGKLKRSNARNLLQHLYNRRLNNALHGKREEEQEKAQSQRTRFPGGKGRFITSEEFKDELRNEKKQKENREKEKAAKQIAKVAQQKEKADKKEERKRLIDQWRMDKHAWEKDLAAYRSHGGLVKNFRAAPRHPTRGKRRPQQSIAFSYSSDALSDEGEAIDSDSYETVTAQSEYDNSEEGGEGE